MVKKSCSGVLPNLVITELNCGCAESTSRYKRIARNAILPFYYDCTNSGLVNFYNPNNPLEHCKKVFFTKNESFYSGTSSNISSSQLTQAMRYSKAAQNLTKTPEGRRNNTSYYNTILLFPINSIWYDGPVKYTLENARTSTLSSPCYHVKNLCSNTRTRNN
jgi:hypothetical protein